MSRLFDPNFVYPSDGMGPYVELEGTVLGVSDFGAVEVRVPEHGEFTGYNETMFKCRQPKAGDTVIIRVYVKGGGWYPDNKIVQWIGNS